MHVLGHIDVDQLRGDRRAVTQNVLNLVHRYAQAVQERRARVPQIMEPDPPDNGQLAPRLEMTVDVAWLDRRTQRCREHVTGVPPRSAGHNPSPSPSRNTQPLPKPKPGEGVGCPAVGLGAVRLTITLAQPLGTRRLVDAYDGTARQVLDPATVLKPTYLPDGYTGGQATWATQPPGVAAREYQGPGASLIVTVGSAALNRHDEHSIEHTTVRGHPATVSNYRGFEQDILVAWSEDATHAVTVYQVSDYEKAHLPLTADQLVRVANSLRASAPPPVPASASPGEDVPALVRSKTHHALTSNTVLQLDHRVQWVKTTTHKWAAVEYGPNASALPADVAVYVVQIQGSFVCRACKSPRPVTGSVMILALPLQPNQQIGEGFIMGKTSYDLTRLGTVHVFKGS